MASTNTLKDNIHEQKLFLSRTILMGGVLLLCTACLLFRLLYLQVFQHGRYTTLSNHNQLEIISIKPHRGLIFDRHGVPLATNIPIFVLEISPNRCPHISKTLLELKKLIHIGNEDIAAFYKQARQHRPFESLPLRMHLSQKERAIFAVNQHRFPGVSIKARFIRHYPLGKSFSHVIGYVGRINSAELKKVDAINYSGTNFMGKVGIEKYYEKLLHGSVGYEQAEIDANGRIIRVLRRSQPINGDSLTLTIDSKLQIAAEKALHHHRGAVVAIEPKSGEILAMVNYPSFDPNPFVTGISHKAFDALRLSPDQPLYNRSIRGQYPLASTIKPFLALTALDDEIIDEDMRIWDKGFYQLPNNNHLYRDWLRSGHGWVNLRRAIKVSCDTYFYNLANLMGIKKIDQTLTKFGFGDYTNIDLKEEVPGLVPTPAWKKQKRGEYWYTGDTLISGIGQGFMLSTPLQLAAATATFANRGLRIQPHLLRFHEAADKTITAGPQRQEKAVQLHDKANWETIIDAMQAVIKEAGGTGRRFGRDAPYSVAAKTGTAQVFSAKFHAPNQDGNLPERLRDHSLFIAFAPVKNPKIAIAVVVENSAIASRVARHVLDYYLLDHTNKITVHKEH